jgi:hypothetical protein
MNLDHPYTAPFRGRALPEVPNRALQARFGTAAGAKIITQMAHHGDLPAPINALHAALEVFEEEGPQQ